MFAIKRAQLRVVLSFCASATLFAGACGPTNGSFNPNEPIESTKMQCCGAQPPAGFIKVDDDWDPNQCGNPSTIIRNVCTYQRFDNASIGTTLKVCAGAGTPAGWVDGTKSWEPTKCGHPISRSDNMKLITRAS